MPNANSGSPQSLANEQSGRNGDLQIPATGIVGRSVLSQMLAQMDQPARPATDDPSQVDAAQADAQPAAEVSPAETEGAENESQPENRQDDGDVLSQSDQSQGEEGDAEQRTSVLIDDDPDVQKHVTELAKLLKSGGLNIGEVKRIEKLLRGKGELETQIQQLSEQVEQLKSGNQNAEPAHQANDNPFARHVKSIEDVRRMQRQMHEVREFCEDNPDGGTFHGREYSPEQVKELRKESRRALEIHLPERAEQIAQAQQTQTVQQQVLSSMKQKRPDLFNIENPLARRRQEIAASPLLANHPHRDHIAVCLALGEAALNAPAAKKPATLPQRQTGKPAAAVTTANAAANKAQPNKIAAAIDRVKKERSRDALAELYRATGA